MGRSRRLPREGAALRKSGRIWAKTLIREDFRCPDDRRALDLRPLGRASQRGRNRKELHSNQISHRLVRTRHPADVADACVDGDFPSFELQVERLHRLWWHRHGEVINAPSRLMLTTRAGSVSSSVAQSAPTTSSRTRERRSPSAISGSLREENQTLASAVLPATASSRASWTIVSAVP